MISRLHLLLLVILTAILFLVNLGGYDLWPPDEPRFAEVTREMMQTNDYLVPRVNGLPYKEKPPLLFWAQTVAAIPFGDVTELPARIPSALAGMITVLLTYLLVTKLYDRRTAFWAAIILATSQRFWWQAHFGQIDMLLTMCVTTSFVLLWFWHKDRRNIYLVGFYLAIAVGTFAKGPPALIFPVLTAIIFFRKQKTERKKLHLFMGLTAVTILFAIWLIPARMAISVEDSVNATNGIASNLFRQTLGRFFLGISHANPPWYYLLNLPVDLFPWSLFFPWTILWVWKQRKEGEEIRFLLNWIVPSFVFFSICIGKRAIYLLPLYPAFAAILAHSILDLMDGERRHWRTYTGIAWGTILLLIGSATFGILLTEYKVFWNYSILIMGLCALTCGGYTLWVVRGSKGSRKLSQLIVLQTTVLLICVSVLGFPLINSHKSAKSFCTPLRNLSRTGVKYDLYSFGFSREEYIYYAEHFHKSIPGELLQIEELSDATPFEKIALQSKMQHAVLKAVRYVPITSISSVSNKEISLLLKALKESKEIVHGKKNIMQSFQTAIVSLLENLSEAMDGASPAFIIVQEGDWRWVLALCPSYRELHIIKDQNVGSRHVLLVANQSAHALLTKTNHLKKLEE
ncbi:MAG: glycosyltransferase family 39 protein [Candidatus Hydrogenedentes bacterium]|nr:glycosyltransferase family 39 protein [Candidatus Hydrogenedentota bacterium]